MKQNLKKSHEHPLASVIIPTKNSEETIGKCLQAICNQQLCDFEIIIIDSGSQDRTLEIVKEYATLIKEVSPDKFSHGYVRNVGSELAKGEVLVYLNQDAIPASDLWLNNLLEPLREKDVAASYARQLPNSTTNPVERFFLFKTYSATPKIHTRKDLYKQSPENFVLLSTVSAAVKRDIWEKFRFHDKVIMSEDQELAVRLLESGYKIAYQPESEVMHSHNYSIWNLFRRYFDSGWSMVKVVKLRGSSILKSLKYPIILITETLDYIGASVINNRVYWAFYALLCNLTKALGFALGTRQKYMPKSLINTLSYTLSKKREYKLSND
ncbi:MAG: glycosyltransferase family 2 protein [Candidatus Hermodarchaeota archaeon]